MDNRIIDTLTAIRDMYGDGVFYNYTKTRNLLHDLSPDLKKERVLVTNFLEMNGYFQLKYAGRSYPFVRGRLIQNYVNQFSVTEGAAIWVTDVFSTLLGYNEIKTGAQYVREQNRAARPITDEPKQPTALNPDKTLSAFLNGKETGNGLIKSAENDENSGTPGVLWTDSSADAGKILTGITDDTGVVWESTATPVSQRKFDPNMNYAMRISADYHSVAVTYDGHVLASGPNDDGQCNVFAWQDIVAVSAGMYFTVGLRKDGRVVATGRNDYGQCNVRQWTDIIAVSAGARHTVGLKKDGTVVATGQNKHGECTIHNWRNVIHIVAGYQCTFGIKKDRRVLVKGNNRDADLMVSHLNGVQDIANALSNRAIALLGNGTIARVGQENIMGRDFSKWTHIKQISAAPDYFAGLLANGTVRLLAYFWEDTGIECSADDWRDIIAIAAGRFHILGLRKDGVLKAAMMHPDYTLNKGQCNVSHWEL